MGRVNRWSSSSRGIPRLHSELPPGSRSCLSPIVGSDRRLRLGEKETDEDRTGTINEVIGEAHGDFAGRGNQRMSLINDALRQAQEAQRKASAPPSPQLQFRPVEPAQHPRHDLGLIVPVALAVMALVALLFIWQLAQGHKASGPRELQAFTQPAAQAKIAPQSATPMPEVVAAAAQPSPPPPQPSPQTDSATGVTNPLAVTAPTTPASPPEAKEQEHEATNSVATTPPPGPKSPPLTLQAIAFNPKHPCVCINGTMLFVGEKLGDLRVVAIDRETVTLVGAGRTNILIMR